MHSVDVITFLTDTIKYSTDIINNIQYKIKDAASLLACWHWIASISKKFAKFQYTHNLKIVSCDISSKKTYASSKIITISNYF